MSLALTHSNLTSTLAVHQIDKLGHTTVRQFFTPVELAAFEACMLDLFLLQAQKIGEYRERALALQDSVISNFEKFCAVYEMMEASDKEALYQVQKFLGSSQRARALVNTRLLAMAADILGSRENRLLVDGPALFVNRPRTERLLYKWHSEAHYYPKRRRFLNVWLPLFERKTADSGTMSLKEGSHLRDFPFAEYQGYDKDSQNKANHFSQCEIPENFLSGYREHVCETDPGDVVLFHRNLVHRSNRNVSDNYSVAVVARIWDPTDDLTLSGSIAATPYGGNIGRPDLVVCA